MSNDSAISASFTHELDARLLDAAIKPYAVLIGGWPPFVGVSGLVMNSHPTFVAKYDAEFAGRLAHRSNGFREIFRALEKQGRRYYRIVETGTVRLRDNWVGDGQSTVLFDQFVTFHDGVVFSIDLDPAAVALARSMTSHRTHCICANSVRFLKDFCTMLAADKRPDLFYLDSFDFEPQDPYPSMIHHIKELLAIGGLSEGTIIAVDDNVFQDGKLFGKGQLVADYFANVGIRKIYEGYQIVWQV